jgi:hypothetical protein
VDITGSEGRRWGRNETAFFGLTRWIPEAFVRNTVQELQTLKLK